MKNSESKENNRKLKESSRAAKRALEKWRKEYLDEGMYSYMNNYDIDEVELMLKLVQLKLRNQQDANV